jgi:cytoskeletal protein CcmA (bactofilin family)
MTRNTVSRAAAVAVILLAAFAAGTGVVAAESRTGGTIVVERGETVRGDLEVFGGSVIVRGTVEGDLAGLAGDLYVAETGRVEGNVEGAAGNVRIAGVVEGDLSAGAGNVVLSSGANVGGDVSVGAGSLSIDDGATVGGNLAAGAQRIVVNGTVQGDAEVGAEEIVLGSGAVIGGDLTYDGRLRRADGAVVRGAVERDPDLVTGPTFEGPAGPLVPGWAFDVYGFLANLVLGAVLLLAFPAFSQRVALRAVEEPVRSGGVGLLAILGVPVALVLLAITVVGIPLAVVGAILFGIVAWAGAVYGRFAVGGLLTAYFDVDSDWVALVSGLVVVAIAVRIPFVGRLIDLLVGLVGVGALALVLASGYRSRREERASREDVETTI